MSIRFVRSLFIVMAFQNLGLPFLWASYPRPVALIQKCEKLAKNTQPKAISSFPDLNLSLLDQNESAPNLTVLTESFKSGAKNLKEKCEREKSTATGFSISCIYRAAYLAEQAMSTEPLCRGKVTANLMMCVFKKEVTWKKNRATPEDTVAKNSCGRWGCGISQMTSAGVETVLRGLTKYKLNNAYATFWSLIGRSKEKDNMCTFDKKKARDRDTSVIMAGTHICALAKATGKSTQRSLARNYNGNTAWASNGRTVRENYASWVDDCSNKKKGIQDINTARIELALKAECREAKTCGNLSLQSSPQQQIDSIKIDLVKNSPKESPLDKLGSPSLAGQIQLLGNSNLNQTRVIQQPQAK